MGSQKLVRVHYRDPVTDDPRTTDSAGQATGKTSLGESLVDQEQYLQPLEKVHGSGLHGWGVGAGMRVSAKANAPNVNVTAGIALDVEGRHISLAVGGKAEVGPGADQPGAIPDRADVLADPAGATLRTPAGAAADYYVTVRFFESFDSDTYNPPYSYFCQKLHTPWLRLEPVAGFLDDGQKIVLAQISLDVNGNVTAMSEGRRRGTAIPVEAVLLRDAVRTSPAPNFVVDNTPSAEIRSRTGGGMLIKVPNAPDEIHMAGPDDGSFARLSVSAERVTVQRSDRKSTVIVDATRGNIEVGTQGVEGDVLVKDASNRLVITLDGGNAAAIVGANGNDGDVRVLDGAGQNAVRAVGSTGDVWFRGLLRDINNSHPGVGHALLRHLPALTNGGLTTLHRHLGGNATRPIVRWLWTVNNFVIEPVHLGSSRNVFAFIAITSFDPQHNFDRGDGMFAEVYRVNGLDHRTSWRFGGDHLGSDGDDANVRRPFFIGQASSIDFRLRSTQDAEVYAIAVVFSEV